MTEANDTPEWVYDFSDVMIATSGSLRGDVAALADHLAELRDSIGIGVDSPAWQLVENDPMGSLRIWAAHLDAVYRRLDAQGFVPPTIGYWDDPMTFISANADFLAKIASYVRDEPVVVH